MAIQPIQVRTKSRMLLFVSRVVCLHCGERVSWAAARMPSGAHIKKTSSLRANVEVREGCDGTLQRRIYV